MPHASICYPNIVMSDKVALKPLELASEISGLPESCQKDLGNILIKKKKNNPPSKMSNTYLLISGFR